MRPRVRCLTLHTKYILARGWTTVNDSVKTSLITELVPGILGALKETSLELDWHKAWQQLAQGHTSQYGTRSSRLYCVIRFFFYLAFSSHQAPLGHSANHVHSPCVHIGNTTHDRHTDSKDSINTKDHKLCPWGSTDVAVSMSMVSLVVRYSSSEPARVHPPTPSPSTSSYTQEAGPALLDPPKTHARPPSWWGRSVPSRQYVSGMV